MKLKSEWNDRLKHWLDTLAKDFYQELGELELFGFTTFDHLTPDEAVMRDAVSYAAGTKWGHEWEYLWLKGDVVLPDDADGKVIVLNLAPGGESTLFVNGQAFGTYRAKWVLAPHHFYSDNILTESGKPGKKFTILCEAYAGHFYPDSGDWKLSTGPVMPGDYTEPPKDELRTAVGRNTYGIWNEDAYALWIDVVTLQEIMENLSDGSLRAAKIAKALQTFMLEVDFEQPPCKRNDDYKKARELLKDVLEAKNSSSAPTFYAIGNAHIDLVWLWPYAETNRKTARTFAAQLRLLDKYPDYLFMQSQPQTYVMCKEHYPEIYEKIKAAVKAGKWIVEGGMWVEPDTNVTSGESLIRQLIHGKRFYKNEFGIDSELLWLPDTFGYSAALPQILNGCGIKYLVTQKIFFAYNDGERFPYNYFTWQGNDGSKITSFLPTGYGYYTNPKTLIDVWDSREVKDDVDKYLFPYGYGDGGGGPCRDHLEYLKRQKNLEGAPKVKPAAPTELFRDLEADGGPCDTYVGELYFSAHRGVYTTHAALKRGNRKSELALREGEMWGAFAVLKGFEYPYDTIDATWKKVLFNQFHDILPGSSIKRANIEAVALYNEVLKTANELIQDAASYIANKNTTIFNSLSWDRHAVITMPENERQILVSLPSCGFVDMESALVTVSDDDAACARINESGAILENGIIKAVFDNNGEITSFILKASGLDYASGSMNRFNLYRDIPRTADAWDIDSMYESELLPTDRSARTTLLYSVNEKAAIHIEKTVGNSRISQIVSICAMSSRLEFDTTVEWNELHRLLKVCFSANIITDEAINEIQYGYIKRPTHRSRQYDKDRFEVCNHRYTALCDENKGFAVLNDSKYGVSMTGNEIRLTLLRAAACPEMRTDNGTQQFIYAITAWEGSFYESSVVREGYELNVPPVIIFGKANPNAEQVVYESFFRFEKTGSVIIDTIKPAEDGSGDIILRLYESKRAETSCTLYTSIPYRKIYITDMLENNIEPVQSVENSIPLHFKPFEVKTLKFS